MGYHSKHSHDNCGAIEMNDKPAPGSDLAVDFGCRCPVLDNNKGAGVFGNYWINETCPLHGVHNAKDIDKEEEDDGK